MHPSDGAKSIVIGTLKNGGLAAFDLQGRTIQRVDYADEDARQNNVDLLYGVELGGKRRDLAVVTDRGLDQLRVFAVDQRGSSAPTPLTEVTEPDPPVIFDGDNDISAYGIAAWKGADGTGYVAISQRHRTTLVLLRLVAAAGGTVGFERLDRLIELDDPPDWFAIGLDRWVYFLSLTTAIVLTIVAANLLRGRIGLALLAIRDHSIAAEAMGINAARYKTIAFGTGALYAGTAGSLEQLPSSSCRLTASRFFCLSAFSWEA